MSDRSEEIESIRAEAERAIAAAPDEKDLDQVRVTYLGRKGRLTAILRNLKEVPEGRRPQVGQAANAVKTFLEGLIAQKETELKTSARPAAPAFDYTLPGRGHAVGKLHLVTQTTDAIVRIFSRMGFDTAYGPEVELDYYNFAALNFPPEHPARDMQDTFYVSEDVVLRTHTSPVQVRAMEKRQPPLKILSPGRVYRHESINVRSHVLFHQVEGFAVDKDITFGDMEGVLSVLAWELFGRDVGIRFRPSFFPFTEPSAEVDISCTICGGKGCGVCKNEGWVEIAGCGMIDPEVFRSVGYDSELYTGYAFGLGVERVAQLKHRIDDVRLFLENDLRFLRQF